MRAACCVLSPLPPFPTPHPPPVPWTRDPKWTHLAQTPFPNGRAPPHSPAPLPYPLTPPITHQVDTSCRKANTSNVWRWSLCRRTATTKRWRLHGELACRLLRNGGHGVSTGGMLAQQPWLHNSAHYVPWNAGDEATMGVHLNKHPAALKHAKRDPNTHRNANKKKGNPMANPNTTKQEKRCIEQHKRQNRTRTRETKEPMATRKTQSNTEPEAIRK